MRVISGCVMGLCSRVSSSSAVFVSVSEGSDVSDVSRLEFSIGIERSAASDGFSVKGGWGTVA